MSTWSNIYFESNHSSFGASIEWALIYQLPQFIGIDYLDCFGWDILEKRLHSSVNERQGNSVCPSDLSTIVKSKWQGSLYRFILEPSEYLLGVDLLNGLSKSEYFQQFDEPFVQLSVSLIKIFQNNPSSLRIIHLVT